MQATEAILDNKPTPAPSPAWLHWLGKAVDWSVICIGGALATLIFINVVMHAMSKDLAWLTELGELMMVFVGWDLILILRGFSREQRYPAD